MKESLSKNWKVICLNCDIEMRNNNDSWSGMDYSICDNCGNKIAILVK